MYELIPKPLILTFSGRVMPSDLSYTAAVCSIGYMGSATPISQCRHPAAKLVRTYVTNVTFMGVFVYKHNDHSYQCNALFAQLRLAEYHIHFWCLLYKQTMYVELDTILLPAMQMATAKVNTDAEICLDETHALCIAIYLWKVWKLGFYSY